MSRRLVVLSMLAVVLVLLIGTSASADEKVVAQQSGCVVGQICDPGQTGGIIDELPPLPPGADPPGAMVRSLVVIGLMAAGFFTYVTLAFQRGSTPKG